MPSSERGPFDRLGTGRCWFCSGTDLPLTDEHVLSEANFGGRLIAKSAVCSPCNRSAGELERQIASRPPLAEYVAIHSRRWRNKPKRSGVDVLTGSGLWGRGQYTETGLEVIGIKPQAGQTARRGNPDVDAAVETTYGMGEKTIFEWPRFGAKVALGMASQVLDPRWLDTDGARVVQAICAGHAFSSRYQPPQMLPCEDLNPEEPLTRIGPGEHVLGLHDYGEPVAWMVLFGQVAYRIAVPDAKIRPEGYAWHLVPRQTPSGPEPVAELRARLRRGT